MMIACGSQAGAARPQTPRGALLLHGGSPGIAPVVPPPYTGALWHS